MLMAGTRRRLGARTAMAFVTAATILVLGAPAAQALPPTITSFSPTSGPVGLQVVITGSGFMDNSVATAVAFNGIAATFTVNSNTQITTSVPAGATTGPITVTDSEGTGSSAPNNFTVTTAPVITSFAPTSGPVGTSVVITGGGFTGATSVTFGGTAATVFTVNSPSQITATVPTGATTGPISVVTPNGTATSTSNFTVTTTEPTVHERTVTLELRRHLIARGRVSSDFADCRSGVEVQIQHRRGPSGWSTVATDTTGPAGRYRAPLADETGRYRALVPRLELGDTDVCTRDRSPRVRHRH
jgi:IPT/TIG domain